MEKVKAFYFSGKQEKLGYKDSRSIVLGETHNVDGKIILCQNGLHASERLIDALLHRKGEILYLVELSGEFDKGEYKICASSRKYLKKFDIEDLLKSFVLEMSFLGLEYLEKHLARVDFMFIQKTIGSSDPEKVDMTNRILSKLLYLNNESSWVESRKVVNAYFLLKNLTRINNSQQPILLASQCIHYLCTLKSYENPVWKVGYDEALSSLDKDLTSKVKEATGWNI